jgi:hypothetical protein
MMGRQTGDQSQLFYLFNLEQRILASHLLRRINPMVTQVLDQRFRRGFTTAEKMELWDRWQRGPGEIPGLLNFRTWPVANIHRHHPIVVYASLAHSRRLALVAPMSAFKPFPN